MCIKMYALKLQFYLGQYDQFTLDWFEGRGVQESWKDMLDSIENTFEHSKI